MFEILLGIGKNFLKLLNDSSFYLVLGFFLAGLIKQFIPTHKLVQHLGSSDTKSIVKAALIGAPLPLCSCGVIPTALTLRKSGASKEATLSFLISTPENGVDSVALTYALLDPVITIFRPIAGVLIAILSGLMEKFLGKSQPPEKVSQPKPECCCEEHSKRKSWMEKLKDSFKYAFFDFFGDIALYLLIGFLLAALVLSLIPADFIFENLGGSGIVPMLILVLVGTPLYICSTSTTPIAAALITQGASPGAALVLLIVGPATNLVTMLSVGKFLGIRTLFNYLLSIIVFSIVFGLILNSIYKVFGLSPQALIGHGAHLIPHYLKWFCTIFLLASGLNILFRKLKKREDSCQTCES